ncbi:MAG: hypothetical protein MRZ79_11015 [Bacteroidia bacterium]|nr:hypothetical protein [Bacteroidia bacterium]
MIRKAVLYFLIAISSFPSLLACECETPSTEEIALTNSTFAFVGKCVLLNTNWMSGGMKYSFQVEKSWKKATPALMIVNVPFVQECGGMKFDIGKDYLVFVEKKFTPKSNRCMGTVPLGEADISSFGEGMSPQQSNMIQPLIWTISILAIMGLAIVLFVVLKRNPKEN